MKLTPNSLLGKWAMYLALAFVVLSFVVVPLAVQFLYPGNMGSSSGWIGELTTRPVLAVSGMLGLVSGLLAFVLSLFAILKSKDRSVLVFVALALGTFVVIFLVGELFGAE